MLLTNQRLDKLLLARIDFTKRGMMKGSCLYGVYMNMLPTIDEAGESEETRDSLFDHSDPSPHCVDEDASDYDRVDEEEDVGYKDYDGVDEDGYGDNDDDDNDDDAVGDGLELADLGRDDSLVNEVRLTKTRGAPVVFIVSYYTY